MTINNWKKNFLTLTLLLSGVFFLYFFGKNYFKIFGNDLSIYSIVLLITAIVLIYFQLKIIKKYEINEKDE